MISDTASLEVMARVCGVVSLFMLTLEKKYYLTTAHHFRRMACINLLRQRKGGPANALLVAELSKAQILMQAPTLKRGFDGRDQSTAKMQP